MSVRIVHVAVPAIAAAMMLGTAVSVVGTPAAAQQTSQIPQTSSTTPATNLGQLLERYPDGGPELIARVRELLVADAANLSLIMGALPTANKNQKSAIASALAQSARIVLRRDQAYATRIQQAVAGSGDQDLIVAYAASAGDVQIGGVGGGAAAGGGGAIGGQTSPLGAGVAGTGPASGIGIPGVGTGAFSYTSSVTGAGGVTTTATTVSP